MGKASTPTSMDMKKYGRNAARAMNQTGRAVGKSAGDPWKSVSYDQDVKASPFMKYGPDGMTVKAANQAIVANEGSPKKATKIRGTGAATKGTMARGPMG